MWVIQGYPRPLAFRTVCPVWWVYSICFIRSVQHTKDDLLIFVKIKDEQNAIANKKKLQLVPEIKRTSIWTASKQNI